ncbi:MAG: diguanylate cyclase [Candidatus Eisenbacteria bacterium]|nr:diguanylate cyclase [Candidatus Eisenbacteria bacterium]
MKVCIPIEGGKDLSARVCAHFGAAPAYLIHDTDSGTSTLVEGTEGEHEHGGCRPLDNLQVGTLDAMIVGGIGPRAVAKLGEAGVRVYRASGATAKENVDALGRGELHEVTSDETCSHSEHGCAD